jgi:Tfp pilus assembly protein, ATPase PilM
MARVIPAGRARVFLSKAFDAIANEIRRTLDFYVSQPDGEPIGKLLLTGGTARLRGIDSFIQNRLGIACEVGSPMNGTLVNVDSLARNPNPDLEEILSTTSAVLLGQCQRSISDVPLRMNFLPPPIVHLKDFQKRRPLLALEAVGIAVLIGFSVVTMGQTIKAYQQPPTNCSQYRWGR